MTMTDNVMYKLNDTVVIKLPYETFSDFVSDHFRKATNSFIQRNLNKVIILDFENVKSVLSSGIVELIVFWNKCTSRGIKLIVCNIDEETLSVIRSKSLDSLIEITTTFREAISKADIYSENLKASLKS